MFRKTTLPTKKGIFVPMRFRDYIDTAQRHLISCEAICRTIEWDKCSNEEKNEILKDLFYLTGYILEALTIYTVYSRGHFNPNKDITELDIKFTKDTHVDYYNTREIHPNKNDPKDKFSISCRTPKNAESYETFNKNLEELNKLIRETTIYPIQSHKFFAIIQNVLNDSNKGLIFSSENIPLFSNIKVSNNEREKKILTLIMSWDSSLRYSTNQWNKIKDILTKENIEYIIILCKMIKKLVYKVG
ncbi:hypothetical protein [Fibrobacter succinogenes]|nr:hypothetical protein [Fibrobacter succinogenes]